MGNSSSTLPWPWGVKVSALLRSLSGLMTPHSKSPIYQINTFAPQNSGFFLDAWTLPETQWGPTLKWSFTILVSPAEESLFLRTVNSSCCQIKYTHVSWFESQVSVKGYWWFCTSLTGLFNAIVECTDMPPGRATTWWKYLRISNQRKHLNPVLEQKVSFVCVFVYNTNDF